MVAAVGCRTREDVGNTGFSEAQAPSGGAKPDPIAPPSPRRRTDLLDAQVTMSTGEITTMLQAMSDNGLERVINHSGGNRADHSLDLWVAMKGEIKGRIVQCWNPPWQLLATAGGDIGPLVQDMVDAVGMFYACASVGAAKPPLPLGDPRLDPLWAKAGELRLPVYLRIPGGEGLPARHPRTRFILTYLPNDSSASPEALLGDHERVYFTLTAFPPTAPPLSLIRRFPDRFVFASGISMGKEISLPGPAGAPPGVVPYGALRPAYDTLTSALSSLQPDIQDQVMRTNLLRIF